MSTEYSGNGLVFPQTVTLPSDGEKERAQSVNDGLSDLADRTAFLYNAASWGVSNWSPRNTLPTGTGVAVGAAMQNGGNPTPIYVVVGGTDGIAISSDFRNWVSKTPTGGTGMTTSIVAPAADSGTWVVGGTNKNFVYRSTDSGATWAASGTFPGASAGTGVNSITWDATNALFIAAGAAAGSLYTSPDGNTWTPRTPVQAFYQYDYAATNGSGTTAMLTASAVTAGQKSTNGTTWSAITLPTPTGSSSWKNIAYHAALGAWFIMSSNGDVYSSTDLATWTQKRAGQVSPTMSPFSMRSIGPFLVAVDAYLSGTQSRIFYSLDGATWRFELIDQLTRLNAIGASSNRLLAIATGVLFYSDAIGPSHSGGPI